MFTWITAQELIAQYGKDAFCQFLLEQNWGEDLPAILNISSVARGLNSPPCGQTTTLGEQLLRQKDKAKFCQFLCEQIRGQDLPQVLRRPEVALKLQSPPDGEIRKDIVLTKVCPVCDTAWFQQRSLCPGHDKEADNQECPPLRQAEAAQAAQAGSKAVRAIVRGNRACAPAKHGGIPRGKGVQGATTTRAGSRSAAQKRSQRSKAGNRGNRG